MTTIDSPQPGPSGHLPRTIGRVGAGLLLLLTAGVAHAELYKHTGPDGEVFYSDRLPPDAQARPIDGRISLYDAAQRSPTPSSSDVVPAPRVVVYTTTWCGACKKAKAYMERNGIRYTEYDVEKSAKAKREFKAMNGRAVPLLVVGDRRMHGFDVERFEALLAAL